MLKKSGLTIRVAVLALVLISIVALLGILPTAMKPAAQTILPTRMVLPTEQPTNQPAAQAPTTQPTQEQPSPIPPTPVPTGEPTAVQAVDTATELPTQVVAPSVETAQPAQPSRPVPNQVVIQFQPGTSPEQQAAYIQELGGTVEQEIEALDTVVVNVPDASAALALRESPLVVQAEPDYVATAQQTKPPNDPYYGQQWGLPVMNVPAGWAELPADTPPITVAVLDSGICPNHPDLAGRLLPGYDFVQKDTNPQDEYGHGCQVTGVIAAVTNNGIGIAGVAPNTRIIPVRVLDATGSGLYSNIAAGIVWAADNGAQIINLSLGGTANTNTLSNAVDYAISRGARVVAAAGNTGATTGAVLYPAAYPSVVAVGSVDANLQRSSFSAKGPEIDIWAPGGGIATTNMSGGYSLVSGTSFATPNVTGVLALNMALGRELALTGGVVSVTLPQPTAPTATPATQFDRYGNPIVEDANAATPTDTWVVVLQPGSNPNTVAASIGFENLGQVGTLPNVYLFRAPGSAASEASAQEVAAALEASAQIIEYEQQFAQQHEPRTPTDDPLNLNQWHLGSANSGANIQPNAWNLGYTGSGVQIAIVDDGLQYTHPDLAPNYLPAGSWDFNGDCAYNPSNPWNCPDDSPLPFVGPNGACSGALADSDCHGTAAAGVAAAADNAAGSNPDYCGVGAAYGAQLSGIRLISKPTTDAQDAAALTYQNQLNDIFSNSWGPTDNGSTLMGPGLATRIALESGITNGRGGRGNIYVWAAGNGRTSGDNVNADGYANSRYVIAVGAVGSNGQYAGYSEPGAAMLVTAPSNGFGSFPFGGITTTDLMGGAGYGGYPANPGCTSSFGGTSSATPLVAGVVALMLEANPDLTWRDVQYILIETAVKNDPGNIDWKVNGAGHDINHNYGFGLIDAAAAVNMAKTWKNVGPEIQWSIPQTVNATIPTNTPFNMTREINLSTGGNYPVEHVEVVFNATHSWRGDLQITLTSPSGTVSRLMPERVSDQGPNYTNWRFMTTLNWGENPNGKWKLNVVDSANPPLDGGTWHSWELIVYAQGIVQPPRLNTPANGSQINSYFDMTSVDFTWTDDNPFSTTDYELQIGQQSNLSDATTHILTTTNYETRLPFGTYYWRVRTRGASGDSQFSPIHSFTIGAPSNGAPPMNFFTTGTPTFTWNRVSWATSYQFQYSATTTFTNNPVTTKTVDGTTLSLQLDANFSTAPLDGLEEGEYYWRVCAVDGTRTVCSTPEKFLIDLP